MNRVPGTRPVPLHVRHTGVPFGRREAHQESLRPGMSAPTPWSTRSGRKDRQREEEQEEPERHLACHGQHLAEKGSVPHRMPVRGFGVATASATAWASLPFASAARMAP
jgi:hypothetical protein